MTNRRSSQVWRESKPLADPRKTSFTSRFGVSKRESHDATDFYARFAAPELSSDNTVSRQPEDMLDRIFPGDARQMNDVQNGSVALVVTSPPYFVGKEYEEHLGQGVVPATYIEYLQMLEEVFAECVKKLEPGGRIAVNVANLGRKPYRSLSSDVITILQDRLRLLLRGEIIWLKARGTSGSCAWGSFQRPANPVLRDITERVIVASKGRFDRALSVRDRKEQGLSEGRLMEKDEFYEATTDVWEIPPESATRVNHPAPFPVELPGRLIRLYTYERDLILDPFMGSGSTAVAALKTKRHYVGYETEAAYRLRAEERIEKTKLEVTRSLPPIDIALSTPEPAPPGEDFQARAVREGHAAKQLARTLLQECGFVSIKPDIRLRNGVEVNFRAFDQLGNPWYFDVSGGFTSVRPGLKRTDTLWKALGKAGVIHSTEPNTIPLVLLTTDRPTKGSAGDLALRALWGPGNPIADVIELMNRNDQERLRDFAMYGPLGRVQE
jgi:site-specific DNA-methyltransferase (adenine-specific)